MTNGISETDGPSTSSSPTTMQLWQIEIQPKPGNPNRIVEEVLDNASFLGLPDSLQVNASKGFLIQGSLELADAEKLARELLVDSVVERSCIDRVGAAGLNEAAPGLPNVIYVLPQPGVTDPEAESALMAIRQLGFSVDNNSLRFDFLGRKSALRRRFGVFEGLQDSRFKPRRQWSE